IDRFRYWPISSGETTKSCLFFSDAAMALILAFEHLSTSPNQTYVVSSNGPATLSDIHRYAYRALGRSQPRPAIPRDLAVSAGAVADRVARMFGRTTRLRSAIQTLTLSTTYDG